MQEQSVKSQVYEALLKDILDGVYEPNSIINEKSLMEKYGVSKTSVREALVQLCSEGLLKNIPRFGYQLSVIMPGEIAEILEYRKIIEVNALELCFNKLTAGQIEELRGLNEDAVRITYEQNVKTHWEKNQDFHRKLCSFCGNHYLMKSLDECLRLCTRIANQYFTKLWMESKDSDAENHLKLVKAIEDQDLDLAKDILITDVEAFKDEIL